MTFRFAEEADCPLILSFIRQQNTAPAQTTSAHELFKPSLSKFV